MRNGRIIPDVSTAFEHLEAEPVMANVTPRRPRNYDKDSVQFGAASVHDRGVYDGVVAGA